MRPSDAYAEDKRKRVFKKAPEPGGRAQQKHEIVVVGGWRPSDKPGRAFSSLLLGVFEGGKLRYRGRVGSGFGKADQDTIFRTLKAGECKASPFLDAPRDAARAARWTTPAVVIEVAYSELTEEGYLSHPTFVSICEEADISDATVEESDDEPGGAPSGSRRRPRRRSGR